MTSAEWEFYTNATDEHLQATVRMFWQVSITIAITINIFILFLFICQLMVFDLIKFEFMYSFIYFSTIYLLSYVDCFDFAV
jgi:hypothetical protein